MGITSSSSRDHNLLHLTASVLTIAVTMYHLLANVAIEPEVAATIVNASLLVRFAIFICIFPLVQVALVYAAIYLERCVKRMSFRNVFIFGYAFIGILSTVATLYITDTLISGDHFKAHAYRSGGLGIDSTLSVGYLICGSITLFLYITFCEGPRSAVRFASFWTLVFVYAAVYVLLARLGEGLFDYSLI